MALYISRFKDLPCFFKVINVIMTLIIIFTLSQVAKPPPGTSLIWLTVCFSSVFDITAITLLLTDRDTLLFTNPFFPYSAFESVVSVFLFIFYVISAMLAMNSNEISDNIWFNVAAGFCLFNAIIYITNAYLYVKKWMYEHRRAREFQEETTVASISEDQAEYYEYPNYGAE